MFSIAWPWVALGFTGAVIVGLFLKGLYRVASEATKVAAADADRFNFDDAPRPDATGRFEGVAYILDYAERRRAGGGR